MDRRAEETPHVVSAWPLHLLPAQVGHLPPPHTEAHIRLSNSEFKPVRCCRDLLMETVPVTRLDFTTVLPRFLSLYVLSFLNPRDLCAAAQVSWQWRFLAEQVSLGREGASAPDVGEYLLHSCLSGRTVCGPRGASGEAGSFPTVQEPENTEPGRTTTLTVSPHFTGCHRGRRPHITGHSTSAQERRRWRKRGGREGS